MCQDFFLSFWWSEMMTDWCSISTVLLYCGEARAECENEAVDLLADLLSCIYSDWKNETADTSDGNELPRDPGLARPRRYCKPGAGRRTPADVPLKFQACPTSKRPEANPVPNQSNFAKWNLEMEALMVIFPSQWVTMTSRGTNTWFTCFTHIYETF